MKAELRQLAELAEQVAELRSEVDQYRRALAIMGVTAQAEPHGSRRPDRARHGLHLVRSS